MSKPRVLLGDDHSLIVEAMRSVLAYDCEVIGAASNGWELIVEAERLKPDAVLPDISMSLLNAWKQRGRSNNGYRPPSLSSSRKPPIERMCKRF